MILVLFLKKFKIKSLYIINVILFSHIYYKLTFFTLFKYTISKIKGIFF